MSWTTNRPGAVTRVSDITIGWANSWVGGSLGFISAGSGGCIARSMDGASWPGVRPCRSSSSVPINRLAVLGDTVVAAGSVSASTAPQDGLLWTRDPATQTWTNLTSILPANATVLYASTINGEFFVAGNSPAGALGLRSTDGLSWSQTTVPGAPAFSQIACGSGRYVAVAGGEPVFASTDAVVPNPSPGNTPANSQFPLGFFSFSVNVISPGAGITVDLYYPGNIMVNAYYKFGPEPGNVVPRWFGFAFDVMTGAEFIAAGHIQLHFADGQRGDDDLSANGQITDDGAPGLHRATRIRTHRIRDWFQHRGDFLAIVFDCLAIGAKRRPQFNQLDCVIRIRQ